MIEEKISNLEKQINSLKKNTNKELKFITFLGLSGLTILLSAFFLTLFGVVDLKYVNDIKLNNIVDFLGNFILFSINLIMSFYIINSKTLKSTLLIIISICFIFNIIFQSSLMISTILPFSIFMLMSKLRSQNFRYLVFNTIIFLSIIFIFQFIFVFIKISVFNLDYVQTNFITSFVYNIDLFLLYIFLLKVVGKNELGLVGLCSKHLVLPKSKSIFKIQSTSKESLDTSDLNARQKALFALMVLGYQLFQLLVVLAIGLVNNMLIELLVMLPLFWAGRMILRKSWHSDKLWLCSVATFSGFYILTKITPPFEISLFLIVALTGLFVYLLHILGVKADRLEELEERYETDFSKYGLSSEMANFAYDWKITGLRDKELMIKYEIDSVNTLNSRKRRIKQAMNTK